MKRTSLSLLAVLSIVLTGSILASTAQATTLPPGFQKTSPLGGLTLPTAVEFAPDGRIYVAEKSGIVKVFDGLDDPTASTFIDLRTDVHNMIDRGLLGLAIDPDFTHSPYIYLSYARDAAIGGTSPRWGVPGGTFDGCPSPPGPNGDGCLASVRLARVPVTPSGSGGALEVLVDDWCQQYPSHSAGDIVFDSTGALLASGGDGASYTFVDWGQDGDPVNPCGDPPGGIGAILTPPTAEGGALRSQDFQTFSGDPTGLNGSVIRVDRATGAPAAGNRYNTPSRGSTNVKRLAAYGLRNPFRMTIRPGTDEVWVGDVGAGRWEEIDRLNYTQVPNYGWPCYEGPEHQPSYDNANLNICENLYTGAGQSGPFFAYRHTDQVVPGEACPTGSTSISGIAFENATNFPAAYDGALFFADYSRDCIWVMRAGADGLPDPSTVSTFASEAGLPVDLTVGPDGALYYPNIGAGTIERVGWTPGNQPPVAAITATPSSGTAPLSVNLDGGGSSDPDPGDLLSYEWDLDDDGQFDDSTAPTLTRVFNRTTTVRLRVSDRAGATATAQRLISVDNTAPHVTITQPGDYHWSVDDLINFAATANDTEQGELGPDAFHWVLELLHCPSNCHSHPIEIYDGVASGSFVAPDHEYPSQLKLTVTATDSGGLTDSAALVLDPATAEVTLASNRPGLSVSFGDETKPTPYSETVIRGSTNSLSAPESQTVDGHVWNFDHWDHGGTRAQNITIAGSQTLTARFLAEGGGSECSKAAGVVFGTSGDDSFAGAAGADAWVADAGADSGGGDSGEDCLDGQSGADVLNGEGDRDRLYGGEDGDRINGGIGSDLILAGSGDDGVAGGDGEETVQAGDGNDVVLGEQQEDRLFGEAGNDLLNSGGHFDYLDGGPGNDYLVGGAGEDHFIAADGERDTLVCGAGNDYVDVDQLDQVRPDCENVNVTTYARTIVGCDADSPCAGRVEMVTAGRYGRPGKRRPVVLGATAISLDSTGNAPLAAAVVTPDGRELARRHPDLLVDLRLVARDPGLIVRRSRVHLGGH